jgi:hypothetical protein
MTRKSCCTFSPHTRQGNCATSHTIPALTRLFSCVLLLASITSCGSDSGLVLSRTVSRDPQEDFVPLTLVVSASPSVLDIRLGGSGTSTITALPQGDPMQSVTFSASGLPPGVTAMFSPTRMNDTNTLTLTASDAAIAGTFRITVTATSVNLTATIDLILRVTAASLVPTAANAYCDANGDWRGPRFDAYAEAPRTCFHTDLTDTPSPGKTVLVARGEDLVAALNAADCGDTVQLQAGASFSLAHIPVNAKGCDDQHWIIVRTSSRDSALPPEHTRINPSYAGVRSLLGRPAFGGGSSNVMAQIVVASIGGFIPGDHYRFIGLEVTRPANGEWHNALFHTQTPRIVFDRCWIHGDPLAETTHLVQIGPGTDHIAVIDSYMNDAHCTAVTGSCIDAQDISASNGGVTIKVVNNFLEASGESILFGGASATALTTDIEIRLNHLFKPMIWNPNDPGFIGVKFVVKNNLELKEGQRVFIEGNFLENTWGGFSQNGANILLTPKNPIGTNGTPVCPICLVRDVTVRYNYVLHGAQGLQVANGAARHMAWSQGGFNYSIHDLIFDGMQYSECFECAMTTVQIGSGYLFTNPPPNAMNSVVLDHITLVTANTPTLSWLNLNGPPAGNPSGTPQMSQIQLTNWIVATGPNGMYPTGGGAANCSVGHKTYAAMIAACWTGASSFAGNVIVTRAESKPNRWPSGNQFASDWNSVGFVNFNGGDGGDYHLISGSPYKGTATDGTDPGANVEAVMRIVPLVE